MLNDTAIESNIPEKHHFLEIASFIGIFIAFVLFLISVFNVYSIPYGIDYGEGYLANMSLELVKGNNPYHPVTQPPWIVSSYPPVFPFINGFLMFLMGPQLIPGRFIATVSFIGIIAISICILRKFNLSANIATLAAGLIFVFPWGMRWAQVVRVDTLGIFFALCGIYLFVRSDLKYKVLFASIFFSLAALTKHSLLAAAVSVLVYAFMSRDKNKYLMLILFAALIPGVYLILNALTNGGLFLHLFKYTANAWFTPRFTSGLGEYFSSTWVIQIVALSGFLMPQTFSDEKRILGYYWLLSHLSLITYGFEGSDTNYFIEPLISTLLLTGISLHRLINSSESSMKNAHGLPSIQTITYSLIIAVIILGRFIDTTDYRLIRINPERYNNGLQLINLVKGTSGEILSEDASFALLGNKPVIIQPYIMSLLTRTGKWDQTDFIQTICEQYYSMIIIRVDLNDPYNTERSGGAYEIAGFDRWTDEMEKAIIDKYMLYGALDVGVGNLWYVYLPRTFGEPTETPEFQIEF